MNHHKFAKLSVLSILIVSLLGLLMRYKIGFTFPFLDQKFLQLSHSHFAFAGWVSFTLMLLMSVFLQKNATDFTSKKYSTFLYAQLAVAFGMLVSFIIQGYGLISIFLSSSSIFISFFFAYIYFQDLKKITLKTGAEKWFIAALGFYIFSNVGTFLLIYMMATKTTDQHIYLGSLYWYLHFQYNGWFFFAIMGLFISSLKEQFPQLVIPKIVFRGFAISCVPAVGLSVLWLNLPLWMFVFVVIAAILQTYSWIRFIQTLVKVQFFKLTTIGNIAKWLMLLVAFSMSIKLLLQLGSVFPALSKLAFGFRPIVIAYLHLILLAIISVYLLAELIAQKLIVLTGLATVGVLVFVVGVYLNELMLGIQGIASLSYTVVPFVNELLFIITFIIVVGLLLLNISQFKKNAS